MTSNARQQLVISKFVAAGYPPVSAAAIVGNGCQESGPNLDSTFSRVHADHGSGGFLEWRDSSGAPRKTRLASFADGQGTALDDLGMQCDFAIWELIKYFPTLDEQLRHPGTRTLANLTANFCDVFENPAPETAGIANRIAHAKEALVAWQEAWQAPVVPRPAGIPPHISAPTAGRSIAVLEQMAAISQGYADEISRMTAEKAVIDKALNDLAGLNPQTGVQAPSVNIIPAGGLPAPPEPDQKGPTMFSMLSINWMTTIAGVVAAVAGVAKVVPALQPYSDMLTTIMGLASGAGLIAAKQYNVTGGTVPQTTEAKGRALSPPLK